MKTHDNAVTYLFVPGDRPERFEKAVRSGADVVIVDLEDAVAPSGKPAARRALADAWASLSALAHETGVTPCLRINGLRDAASREDLVLCQALQPALVMVPKVESAAELAEFQAVVPSARVLALVESAGGVLAASAIAKAPNVARLVLGSVDLMLNLGVGSDREPLDWARSMLLLASVGAGIAGPVDGVCTTIHDLDRVQCDARRAREFGFTAKLCIHPKQIGAVDAAFNVTDDELAWAGRVVAASEASEGAATTVDGAMIDAPVLLRAQCVIARHAGQQRRAAT